jgi:hypothetical protein
MLLVKLFFFFFFVFFFFFFFFFYRWDRRETRLALQPSRLNPALVPPFISRGATRQTA